MINRLRVEPFVGERTMRYLLLAAFVMLSSSQSCHAENFLSKMAQELAGGQGQVMQPGTNAIQAGNTSLPAGQYMMTNMSTGIGFYVFVTGNGQMFAQDPRQSQFSFGGGGGLLNRFGQQQQQFPPGYNGGGYPPPGYGAQPAQPQGRGGFGGLMRGALDTLQQGQQQQPGPDQ